ncbi:sugar phosphate isomerase/epimerase family protein [Agrobacterium vitis]
MTTDVPKIAGYGFSSGDASPDLSDLPDILARIEDTGATHCELNLARYELIVNRRILPEKAEKLARICAARNLRYTVHGALAVNFMDEANLPLHRDVFAAMLELAGIVGASILVHHAAVIPAAPVQEIDRLHAIERNTLGMFAERAQRLGVRIGVETLFVEKDDMYTADPFRLANEIEAIGHPNVVGTLDFSHAFIMTQFRGLDFKAAVRRFADVAGHVHVHDSFGRPRYIRGHSVGEDVAYGMGDLHLPPGLGAIPWMEILPPLPFKSGTVLNVELRRRHFSEMPHLADFMRQLVQRANTIESDAI